MNTLESVKEFHQAFDCPIADAPQLPAVTKPEVLRAVAAKLRMCRSILREHSKGDLNFLRASLEVEEQAEVLEAMADGNLKGVLDAYLDKRYIDEGSILTFGLQDVFDEGFRRVHQSNLSKLVDGKPIKDEAGKVKKPPTYKPVVLDDLVDGTWLAANLDVEDFDIQASSNPDELIESRNPYIPCNAEEIANSVAEQLRKVDGKVKDQVDELMKAYANNELKEAGTEK